MANMLKIKIKYWMILDINSICPCFCLSEVVYALSNSISQKLVGIEILSIIPLNNRRCKRLERNLNNELSHKNSDF